MGMVVCRAGFKTGRGRVVTCLQEEWLLKVRTLRPPGPGAQSQAQLSWPLLVQ